MAYDRYRIHLSCLINVVAIMFSGIASLEISYLASEVSFSARSTRVSAKMIQFSGSLIETFGTSYFRHSADKIFDIQLPT